MKLRLTFVALEVLAFMFVLIALLEFWWKIPLTAPFWPTVGYTFAFLGMALVMAAVVLFTLLFGRSK